MKITAHILTIYSFCLSISTKNKTKKVLLVIFYLLKKRPDEDPSVFLSFQNKNNPYLQIRVTFARQKALNC